MVLPVLETMLVPTLEKQSTSGPPMNVATGDITLSMYSDPLIPVGVPPGLILHRELVVIEHIRHTGADWVMMAVEPALMV